MEGIDTHSFDLRPSQDDPGTDEPDSPHRTESSGTSSWNGNPSEAALSTTRVENDFVTGVYQRLAKVYDWIFGPTLHHGRVEAIDRMELEPGARVLEVGVGTGITASIYPEHCDVTGIDFSAEMLKGLDHVRLLQMDAAHLEFPDDSFDVVHAAYVMSVVAEPLQVAREMLRVCRPGGRVVILNHFRSHHPVMAALERAISPITVHVGFKSDLDLGRFLSQAGLQPISVEKVNFPRWWSLVTCVKEAPGESPPDEVPEVPSEESLEEVPETLQPSGGPAVLQR
jgi:phosphatidylethanolamine/phosphatidyl-N-methylethanolamine N-methyltransferase